MERKNQSFTYEKFFRYLLRFAGKRKYIWAGLLAVSLLSSSIVLLDPLLLQFLIDNVLVHGQYQLITLVVVLLLILKLLSLGLFYVHAVGYASFFQHTFLEVRANLYEHLQHKEIGFFKKRDVGDLMRTLSTDITSLQQMFSVLEGVIVNGFRLVVILIIMYIFDWRLLLLAFLLMPLFVCIQAFYLKRVRLQAEKQIQADVDLSNFFQQRISNIFLIKLFSTEATEAGNARQLAQRYAQENIRFVAIMLLLSTILGLISGGALIGSLWIGSLAVAKGVLTIGGLMAVYAYLGQMFGPLSSLSSVPSSLQVALASGERLFYVLQAPEEEHEKGIYLYDIKGSIRFDHVTFAYPTSKTPILKDCSFEIAPGETVGIVGASGVGKTTIAKLLLRFHQVQKGEITIDHVPIGSISRKSLRRRIGVVPQQDLFFPGTVLENLTYATPYATQEQVEYATRQAAIHDTIWKLESGYQTVLAADGGPLSDGEKQRLSIARVLIKRPNIFVFDEPTAQLDTEAEDKIKQTIAEVAKKHTAIIIAHRFSSLDLVDRIIVLKDGHVAEEGTFDALLKKKGEFARLYQLQKHKHRS